MLFAGIINNVMLSTHGLVACGNFWFWNSSLVKSNIPVSLVKHWKLIKRL